MDIDKHAEPPSPVSQSKDAEPKHQSRILANAGTEQGQESPPVSGAVAFDGLTGLEQKTKILFVNRSYWPDMEATGQLLAELCEGLSASENYDVSVLCGQPNFVDEKSEFRKRGSQARNGVTIRRVPHTQFDKKRFWRRGVNFISFSISAFFSLLFGKRPDIIVCQTDPPISPLAACLVAFIRRTKFVCYLQDIYPDIAVECGKLKEGFVVKILRKLLVWCYCRADRIVVVSNDMRDWLKNHGVDAAKVDVIQNWVDIDSIRPIKKGNPFRAEHLLDGKFVVMYSGNIGQTQRFEVILEAARRLQDNENIVFMFVGSGVKRDSLQEQVERHNLDNVRFLDYQPKSKLAESLSAADVQIVLLDQRMTRLMMPSKLYSALASGTPILGVGHGESHLAEIVIENECGWFFEESQIDEIIDQIQQLVSDPGQIQSAGENGRRLAVNEFSRTRSISNFVKLTDGFGGQQQLLPIEKELAVAKQ